MSVSKEVGLQMQAELKAAGQTNFIPLFPVNPAEIRHASVVGNVVEGNFNNLEFHIFNNDGEQVGNYPINGSKVTETQNDAVLNIGKFVCIRDFVSKRGNPFVKGETYRYFAYVA